MSNTAVNTPSKRRMKRCYATTPTQGKAARTPVFYAKEQACLDYCSSSKAVLSSGSPYLTPGICIHAEAAPALGTFKALVRGSRAASGRGPGRRFTNS
jgi:hypothetical protein